jgi:hypothetical protein
MLRGTPDEKFYHTRGRTDFQLAPASQKSDDLDGRTVRPPKADGLFARGPSALPFQKQNLPLDDDLGRHRTRFRETDRTASDKVCRRALRGSPEAFQSGSELPQTFLRGL